MTLKVLGPSILVALRSQLLITSAAGGAGGRGQGAGEGGRESERVRLRKRQMGTKGGREGGSTARHRRHLPLQL